MHTQAHTCTYIICVRHSPIQTRKQRKRGRHKTEGDIREKAVSREDVPDPKKLDCDQIL